LPDSYTIDELSKNIFYIDDFCIDSQRGVISSDEEEHAIEPKVMTVLLFLAAQAGHVVEQETLFAKVWPRSIYSPGSIRRCITVLRKVFRDDAKKLIRTHPKRGYSLNVEIQLTDNSATPLSKKSIFVASLIATFFIILSYFSFYHGDAESLVPKISHVTPITSTAQLEDFAQISPDGKYLAFVRSPKENHRAGHIWLKDLTNDKEYKLSESPIYARNLSWHEDSKALLYVAVKETGLDIVRLSLGRSAEESRELLILSKPSLNWISDLAWGGNNKLYFVAKNDTKNALFSYDINTGEEAILLITSDTFSPSDLALSPDRKQLALKGWHNSKKFQVKFLSVKKLEEQLINVVHELTLDTKSYGISWHPDGSSLMLNDGRHLYHLALSGKINKIDFENYHFIRFAHFSPDATTISVVLEKLDLDILISPVNGNQQARVAFDSNSMDRAATFSPTGDRFVFITESRGYPQIVIHHLSSGENQLIYENSQRSLAISPPIWNALGNQVAFADDEQPIIIDLNTQKVTINKLDYANGIPVQWYSNEQSLLLAVYDNATPLFAKLALNTKHLSKIVDQSGNSAYLNSADELLLISKQSIDKHISVGLLESMHTFGGHILRQYRTIQGIYLYVKEHKQFNLWFYSFANQSMVKIKQWPVDQRIIDVDHSGNFMLTDTINIEKDIVFLSVQ
jgi:DNA-binding winged helix-turn-helix (wHTH) protein/Tol biopolymer transport system component